MLLSYRPRDWHSDDRLIPLKPPGLADLAVATGLLTNPDASIQAAWQLPRGHPSLQPTFCRDRAVRCAE